ncbi:hypothetical protein SXCC_04743 [Gluconacetobacter sp. SXCC-1]|nr:hypothetical protein SXCC_04743 [Gluconacetobacter sp. SXCC-1]
MTLTMFPPEPARHKRRRPPVPRIWRNPRLPYSVVLHDGYKRQ